MVLLAGFFLGAAYTIVVVLGQKLIPGGMGLASGLILGFVFSSGALGVAFTGGLADLWGFDRVFLMTAAIALVGGFASLFLTRDEKKPANPQRSSGPRASDAPASEEPITAMPD